MEVTCPAANKPEDTPHTHDHHHGKPGDRRRPHSPQPEALAPRKLHRSNRHGAAAHSAAPVVAANRAEDGEHDTRSASPASAASSSVSLSSSSDTSSVSYCDN